MKTTIIELRNNDDIPHDVMDLSSRSGPYEEAFANLISVVGEGTYPLPTDPFPRTSTNIEWELLDRTISLPKHLGIQLSPSYQDIYDGISDTPNDRLKATIYGYNDVLDMTWEHRLIFNAQLHVNGMMKDKLFGERSLASSVTSLDHPHLKDLQTFIVEVRSNSGILLGMVWMFANRHYNYTYIQGIMVTMPMFLLRLVDRTIPSPIDMVITGVVKLTRELGCEFVTVNPLPNMAKILKGRYGFLAKRPFDEYPFNLILAGPSPKIEHLVLDVGK